MMVAKRNGGEAGGQTGNYYYRNRYYHPKQGRFMSRDPIGYGDGMNMYAYVGNDPVNYSDPKGLAGKPTENPTEDTSTPKDDIPGSTVTANRIPNGGGPAYELTGGGIGGNAGARTFSQSELEEIVVRAQRKKDDKERLENLTAMPNIVVTALKPEKECVEPSSTHEVLSKFLGSIEGSMAVTGEFVQRIEADAEADLSKTRKGRRFLKRQARRSAASLGKRLGRGVPLLGWALSISSVADVAYSSGGNYFATIEQGLVEVTVGVGALGAAGAGGVAGSFVPGIGNGAGALIGGIGYAISPIPDIIENKTRQAFRDFVAANYCSS